jgi:hypothetical protein
MSLENQIHNLKIDIESLKKMIDNPRGIFNNEETIVYLRVVVIDKTKLLRELEAKLDKAKKVIIE